MRRGNIPRVRADVRVSSRLVDESIARGQIDRIRPKFHRRHLIDVSGLVDDVGETRMLFGADRELRRKMRRKRRLESRAVTGVPVPPLVGLLETKLIEENREDVLSLRENCGSDEKERDHEKPGLSHIAPPQDG